MTLAEIPMAVPAYIHTERCWPDVNKLSPCEAACPLHMDIPNYILAIYQGNPKQALSVIRESNPLPSVCGRVCHHPCETECNRKLIDDPVAIEWLKRYAVDSAKLDKPTPVPRTKEARIAIIGSGPAGLTAAHDLVKMGYATTVFEASSGIGGMLFWAIPKFILSQEALQADIDYLKDLGVKIHTNVRIGDDLSLSDLKRQGYQAILIATGTQQSAPLNIPGSELGGIDYALPYLRNAKLGKLTPVSGKVWVIGGGGVALDVARTAIRLGADEVHIACLESAKDMPAFDWEIEAATREGIRIHPSLAPQEFTSGDGSRISGIRFQRVVSTSLDSEGRIHWTLMEDPGSHYNVEADKVVIAIGQVPDIGNLVGELLKTSNRGGITVNELSMQTNVSGIFAAGDISGTGGTVTEAMVAGRRAAVSIDQSLSGTPVVVSVQQEIFEIEPEQVPIYFRHQKRWDMPRLLPKEALRTFQEVDLGYEKWQAIEEASRCLNCRMCGNCIFERSQMCFETAGRLL